MMAVYPYIPTSVEKILLAWSIAAGLLLVAWAVQTLMEEKPRSLKSMLFGVLIVAATTLMAWSVLAHDRELPAALRII